MVPSRMPKSPADTGRSTTSSVRMPEGMKARLQELAAADDRTLNYYIVRVLTEHLEAVEGGRA